MAELQTKHRINLESTIINEKIKQIKLGQKFGFAISLVGLGLATYLSILGHDTVAGIFATSTIVGLVVVFVIGKKSQKEDKY